MNLLISTPQIVSFIRLLQSLNVNAFFPFHGYSVRALSLICSQEHPVKTSEVFKTQLVWQSLIRLGKVHLCTGVLPLL